tara:strand:- start:1198 stop:1953 length:756 start_codon:yes stop_codon:yes gene_type:complete
MDGPIYDRSNEFLEESEAAYEKEKELRKEITEKDAKSKKETELGARISQLVTDSKWYKKPKFGSGLRLNGDTFIKKVLEGEIDFQQISLKSKFRRGLNLNECEQFDEMVNYLTLRSKDDDFSSIYRFDKADLSGLTAHDITFPSFYASTTNLKKADISGKIYDLFLGRGTALAGSKLELKANGSAYRAKFTKTDLTNFESENGFIMCECDLRGAIGLNTTKGIYFKNCIVTQKEAEIIDILTKEKHRYNIK